MGDHYSKTKSIAEQLVLAHSGKGNFQSGALRLNGIFGPGEMRHIPRIINNIRSGVVSLGACKDEHGGVTDFINTVDFIQPLIKHYNKPLPRVQVPMWLMSLIVALLEFIYRWVYKIFDFQPLLTRAEFFKSSITHYCSIEKARRDFDYVPTRPNDMSDIINYISANSKVS